MEQELTLEGIIFMAFGWIFVLSMITFSMWKVLRTGNRLDVNDDTTEK